MTENAAASGDVANKAKIVAIEPEKTKDEAGRLRIGLKAAAACHNGATTHNAGSVAFEYGEEQMAVLAAAQAVNDEWSAMSTTLQAAQQRLAKLADADYQTTVRAADAEARQELAMVVAARAAFEKQANADGRLTGDEKNEIANFGLAAEALKKQALQAEAAVTQLEQFAKERSLYEQQVKELPAKIEQTGEAFKKAAKEWYEVTKPSGYAAVKAQVDTVCQALEVPKEGDYVKPVLAPEIESVVAHLQNIDAGRLNDKGAPMTPPRYEYNVELKCVSQPSVHYLQTMVKGGNAIALEAYQQTGNPELLALAYISTATQGEDGMGALASQLNHLCRGLREDDAARAAATR